MNQTYSKRSAPQWLLEGSKRLFNMFDFRQAKSRTAASDIHVKKEVRKRRDWLDGINPWRWGKRTETDLEQTLGLNIEAELVAIEKSMNPEEAAYRTIAGASREGEFEGRARRRFENVMTRLQNGVRQLLITRGELIKNAEMRYQTAMRIAIDTRMRVEQEGMLWFERIYKTHIALLMEAAAKFVAQRADFQFFRRRNGLMSREAWIPSNIALAGAWVWALGVGSAEALFNATTLGELALGNKTQGWFLAMAFASLNTVVGATLIGFFGIRYAGHVQTGKRLLGWGAIIAGVCIVFGLASYLGLLKVSIVNAVQKAEQLMALSGVQESRSLLTEAMSDAVRIAKERFSAGDYAAFLENPNGWQVLVMTVLFAALAAVDGALLFSDRYPGYTAHARELRQRRRWFDQLLANCQTELSHAQRQLIERLRTAQTSLSDRVWDMQVGVQGVRSDLDQAGHLEGVVRTRFAMLIAEYRARLIEAAGGSLEQPVEWDAPIVLGATLTPPAFESELADLTLDRAEAEAGKLGELVDQIIECLRQGRETSEARLAQVRDLVLQKLSGFELELALCFSDASAIEARIAQIGAELSDKLSTLVDRPFDMASVAPSAMVSMARQRGASPEDMKVEF